jgi:hypothetical protein
MHPLPEPPDAVHVTTIEVDGRRYDVTVEITHDGIEYLGSLAFTDEAWSDDDGARDHGLLHGRRHEDVTGYARALTEAELVQRYRRAVVEKRRYHGMRRVTEQVLDGIRHLNRVATSMRAGLLGLDDAAAEIDRTERELHELVDRLRHVAGVES